MEIKKRSPSTTRGYSMIELVIVVGLTSILAIAITAIMMTSLLSSRRVRTLAHIRQSGDFALNQMKQLIRNSKTIEECYSGSGNSFDDYLRITGLDGGETTIEVNGDGIDTNYRLASSSATTLYYMSDDIKLDSFDLSCTPTDSTPDLIRIRFTISADTPSSNPYDDPSVSFETTVQPRNQ